MSLLSVRNDFIEASGRQDLQKKELIRNGTMADSAFGWGLTVGWTWTAGKITHTDDAEAGYLYQERPWCDLYKYGYYKVTYTVSDATAGTIQVGLGSNPTDEADSFATAVGTNGVHTANLWCQTEQLTFVPAGNFDGSISDVSILDLSVPGGITAGADKFINSGQRYLDSLVTTQKTEARFQNTIYQNFSGANFPYCKSIKEVWLMNADGRTLLDRKTLKWIREEYPLMKSATTQGQPLYWAPAVLEMPVSQGYYEDNEVTNGSFTGSSASWTLGAGWSYGDNKVSHAAGSIEDLSQAATVLTADDGQFYTVTYTLEMSAGSILMRLGSTYGTRRYASGVYTDYVRCGPTEDLTFSPSSDFVGSVDEVSVNKVMLDFSYDYDDITPYTVPQFNGIVLAPPSDGEYTLTVFGDFFSKPLVADTDCTYWTEVRPDILVLAACYQLEMYYRNMSGAENYRRNIDVLVDGIRNDKIRETVAWRRKTIKG
jgi:hypothetical protein